MFSRCGPVARLVLPPSHALALVEYNEPQDARAAFKVRKKCVCACMCLSMCDCVCACLHLTRRTSQCLQLQVHGCGCGCGCGCACACVRVLACVHACMHFLAFWPLLQLLPYQR